MSSLLYAGLLLLGIFQLQHRSFFIMANSSAGFEPRSQRLFSGDLFSSILDKKSLENVIYSPASIHSCLALTYLGANGQTAQELRQVLYLEQEDKILFAGEYGNFLKTISYNNSKTDANKPQLKMSTRLYVNSKIKILPRFNRLAQDSFGCEAENVDFSRSPAVVEKINKWVEDQTENKIKNLLEKDAVDEQTTSILVNTIYFKANWLRPFSAFATSKEVFHVSATQRIEVDTMYTDDRFAYAELDDINAKVLEMPYDNSDISMLVIVPTKLDGLKELERNLKGRDLNDISAKLRHQSVDVFLPKFRIEFNIDLKETLEKMGCSSMFASNANLTGIFDSTQAHKISEVKHKAFFDCNEAGSEAAAATYMKIVPMSLDLNKKVFRADRPFVFVVRSKNVIYFAGHVTNLSN